MDLSRSPQTMTADDGFLARVQALIARIPAGSVATYGQIAALAGHPRRARHVGQALAHTPPGRPLPWHRVVNAQGRISAREGRGDDPHRHRDQPVEHLQQRLLEAEGVVFRAGRIDLDTYRWRPEETAWRP